MAINMLHNNGSGLSLNQINRTIYQGLSTQESRLRDTLSRIGGADGSVSQTDMLRMQQEIQQWSILVDIQATITKQLSDSIKSVIQKAA
ncbi:MAG TPA: EscF/YscF/HrpA family type III secretion system needle major subunit [Burkholderiaceae bacterium]|nr:EscF/YscF/HrpA family type III secretion system needle major subunit [Burkholderiaceae bacterium]